MFSTSLSEAAPDQTELWETCQSGLGLVTELNRAERKIQQANSRSKRRGHPAPPGGGRRCGCSSVTVNWLTLL